MRAVTNLGDAAVLLPLAAGMLLWLLVLAGRRSAIVWCWSFLVAGGGTAALKIYGQACAAPFAIDSPSGHASMSMFIYGGFALVAGAETRSWPRFAAGAAGAAMIGAVALSRVLVGAHSAAEVLIGLAIGSTALALFAREYLRERRGGRPVWPFLVAAGLFALALDGHQAQLEPLWHMIGAALRGAGGVCAGAA
jgi:membrane-associated phospholipid phosphatase